MDDLISRQSIKKKLQEHHDFFIKAYGGFKNLPLNDKSRVDEITNCIAEIVNEPSVHPEPFINKPCVSEQACREDKMKVLGKIRAELERRGGNDEKAFCKSLNESYKLGLRQAIEIIDKYMAESEDKK